MFRPYLGGGWDIRVGGEGAYPDLVITSCHVRVALGMVLSSAVDWGLEWCEAP